MPGITLDHVNIRTGQMAQTIAFYTRLLGLVARPAPMTNDMAKGAWLHDQAGHPVVHLSGRSAGDAQGSGTIDHIAFTCTGFAQMRAALIREGVTFRENGIAAIGLKQLFVPDPNGIVVELNFREEGDATS